MGPLTLVFVIALLFTAPAEAAARAGPWQRPVGGPVLRAFAVTPADHYARGQHRGVDLQATVGARVEAACGGPVTFAGRVPGGGGTVSVRCGRLVATYQQLGTITTRRGERLLPGARLGTVGRTRDPHTPQPHVHLSARIAATGRYVDPVSLLGNAGQPLPILPPARAPAGPRRAPLGPAPQRPVVHPAARRIPASAPARAPAQPASTPWTVWLGLFAVGLGLPLGGLATITARRRHRNGRATVAVTPATP